MKQSLFQSFADIAYAAAGIRLPPGKETLVHSRVSRRVRALGLADEAEYLTVLQADETGEELTRFLDVITTNYTRFMREPEHFALLAQFIEERLAAGQRRFRIWSAASSSGEEPYSMAITCLEAIAGRPADVRILATDISTRMLEQARAGVYPHKTVAEVPPVLRARYFEAERARGADRDSATYTVRPEVRSLVVYRRLNLATPPLPLRGPLDLIFCRNVMIYFDRPVRQRLISEFERLLCPEGLLLIGHTETLTGIRNGLRTLRPSVFRKPQDTEDPTAPRRPSSGTDPLTRIASSGGTN